MTSMQYQNDKRDDLPESTGVTPSIQSTVGNVPKGNLRPGENPNKNHAKRRQRNRPKTPNVPREDKPPERNEFKWIDPITDTDSVQGVDLFPQLITVPSGYITLDPNLPCHIADSFCSTLSSVFARTVISEKLIKMCCNALRAQCYFKSARQLYSTLSDSSKSNLQPLKNVFYSTSKIPKHMASAISMIGNFDSKIGKVEVKYAETLFKIWVAKGVKLSQDLSKTAPDLRLYNSYVWLDQEGFDIFTDKANTYFKTIHETQTINLKYEVPQNGDTSAHYVDVKCSVPLFTRDEFTIQDIRPCFPDHENMTKVFRLMKQGFFHRQTGTDIDNFAANNECLSVLGLSLSPSEFSITNLREGFDHFSSVYETTCSFHIESVFHLTDAPSNDKGFGAQIVSTEQENKVQVNYKLPVSDSDRALGFMFSPCIDFEINPKFVAYSKRNQRDVTSKFAGSDAKTIAL